MVRLRLFLLLLTALVALSAFSVDAQKLVEYAVKNDITFQQSYLTYQQAVEDYQRSMIYSSTKLDETIAKISLLKAKADLRSSMKSLVDRVVGGYFDVLIQKIQLEILENEATITENNLKDTKELLEKGMTKESDVKSLQISKERTLINIDAAKENLKISIENIFWYLGVDSTSITLPVISPSSDVSEKRCLLEDITLKQASLTVLKASLELDQLVNASEYDISKAKRNLQLAKLSYEVTQKQRKNSIHTTFSNLKRWERELKSLKEELSLIEEELNEATEKYQKGFASQNDVLKKKNSLLSKKKEILQKQKEIVTTYLKLMVDCGLFDGTR